MRMNKIIIFENSNLHNKCQDVTSFNNRYDLLINDMKKIIEENDAFGLAAPQIGLMEKIIVLKIDNQFKVYFNPQIKKMFGLQFYYESCLSVPGTIGLVRRPYLIELEAYDQKGNYLHEIYEGFEAITICHEIDHLEGILYIDRAIEVITTTPALMEKIRRENPRKVIDKNKKFSYEKRNIK